MKFLQKLFNPALLLFSAALFPACETVVEMPIPEHVPKLAIRYMMGSEIPNSEFYAHFPQYQAYVNHSQSLFATEPLEGINNATLVLTDGNDNVVETFQQDYNSNVGVIGNGYYQPVSNFIGSPGQKYTFTVSAPGYKTVSSTLTLPDPITGLQGTFTKIDDGQATINNEVIGNVNLTLPDNGAQNNYYLLYGILLDDQRKANPRDYFYERAEDEDFVVGSNLNDIHFSMIGYTDSEPFDDKTFNGTTLNFSRQVSLYVGDSSKPPRYLRVYLHSITEDTHRFLKSLNAYRENGDNPFAEATRVIGNVNNGYGYFGGFSSTYVDIPL